MMRDGFTYASEPDKNGQVTVVEYGRDPETGRMQVISAVQKTVSSYAGGGMTQSGIERILAQSGRSRPNPMYDAPQVEGPEVTAPMVWKSAPDHPPTMLAYITPQEAELLSSADIHNSGVSRERHYGPRGIPSFNGDAGGGEAGAPGTGGSDTGSGGFDGSDAAVSAASYGGMYGGQAAPAAGGISSLIDTVTNWGVGKINEAINNPIATAINTVVGVVAGPIGLANTVSGLFGGPTIGGLATAAGRSVGESLGISNQGTPETVAQGIGPAATIAGIAGLAGMGPAKGDYGDLGGYGGGSDASVYYPVPQNPGMTTIPPVTPPSYGIGQPGGTTTPPPSPPPSPPFPPPPLPPYNPVVASTMPFFAPTQASGSGMSPMSPFYVPQTPASLFTPPPIEGYGIAALPGYGQGPVANPFALV